MAFSGNSTQAQAIGRYGLWNTGLRDPDPSGAAERAETAAELRSSATAPSGSAAAAAWSTRPR